MADCFDQILCNQSTDCTVEITDENGLPLETRYLHDGEIIYLRVPERPGYTFTGFTYISLNGEEREIIVTEVSNGVYETKAICGGSYVANFIINIYELSVIPEDSAHGITLGSGDYPYGTVVQISAYENNGYHFIGWYIDNTIISTEFEYSYTVTDNTTIVGKFEGDNYSIVALPNNPMLGETTGTGVYEYGEITTLTATPHEGCWFVQWNDGDTTQYRTITVTENKRYVAIFKKHTYTVTVIVRNLSSKRSLERGGVATGDGEYDYGTFVTLWGYPDLGFSLVSWTNNTTGEVVNGGSGYSFTLTGNTTIYVDFNDVLYTLTLYSAPEGYGYTTNGISGVVFTGGTYPYGAKVTAQAIPYSDYEFDIWSDNTTTVSRTFVMLSDITQTAYFKQKPARYMFKIYFNSSQGEVKILNSSVDITNYGSGYVYAEVDEGAVLTVTINGIGQYVFDRWDDGEGDTTRTFTLNSDITREVFFTGPHTLTLCSDFGWEFFHIIVDVDGQIYEVTSGGWSASSIAHESHVTVTVVPNFPSPQYTVTWVGYGDLDVTFTDTSISFNITEDVTELCPTVEKINTLS